MSNQPKDYGDGRDITPEDDEHIKWLNSGFRAGYQKAKREDKDSVCPRCKSSNFVKNQAGEVCSDCLRAFVSWPQDTGKAPTSEEPKPITGVVNESGGGMVSLLIDRDTESYPAVGQAVTLTSEEHDIDSSHSKTEADIASPKGDFRTELDKMFNITPLTCDLSVGLHLSDFDIFSLKAAITELVEQVIGEDDPLPNGIPKGTWSHEIAKYEYNHLRAKLRQKVRGE